MQRDDGWKGMGGEEQVLMYTLEEISGSAYALQKNSLGGSQVRNEVLRILSRGVMLVLRKVMVTCNGRT